MKIYVIVPKSFKMENMSANDSDKDGQPPKKKKRSANFDFKDITTLN